MAQGHLRQRVLGHALRDVVAGERAVAADEVGRAVRHRLEDGLADLHRHRMRRRLHAVGAGMARATLDGVELDLRPTWPTRREHLLGLPAHFCTRRRGRGCDRLTLPSGRFEVGLQEVVAMAGDEVLEGVEHRRLYERQHQLRPGNIQSQLQLEHQTVQDGTRRPRSPSLPSRISRQHRDVRRSLCFSTPSRSPSSSAGHAAAAFLLDDLVGDVVVAPAGRGRSSPMSGLAGVDATGGKDRHLARAAPAVADGQAGNALFTAPLRKAWSPQWG